VICRIAKKLPAYKERHVTVFSESGRVQFLSKQVTIYTLKASRSKQRGGQS
jgi:hypothetical protein